jgi:hypothetical protein
MNKRWFYPTDKYEETLEKQRSNHVQDYTRLVLSKGDLFLRNYLMILCCSAIFKNIRKNLPPACYDLYTELNIAGHKMLGYKFQRAID